MKLAQLALLALLAGAAGCSDDDSDLVTAPLPECPDHDYTPCDTRSAACQQRLLSLAGCVYGATEVPDVPVHVVSEAEFRDALEAGQAEVAQEQTEEDVAATELLESALVDLRLVEVGALSDEASIDSIVESFVGVYQDPELGVILVDRRTPQNTAEADSTLVHEFVHALQDAQYGLDDWSEPYRTSTDQVLAIRSVIEGEATYYGLRVGYAMLGHPAHLTDWEGVFENLRTDLDARALGDLSPYVAGAATFPYGYGGTLAYRAWLERGQGFEAELIEAPPLSTGNVLRQLFPDDIEAAEEFELPEPTATGDYTLLDHEVLGAWLLRMLLVKFDLDDSDAQPLAGTWTADHLWLYRDAEDRRAWLWQLQLTTDSAASFIADLLELESPPGIVIDQAHNRLFVSNGTDGPPQELLDAGNAFIGLADVAPAP